MAFYYDVCLQGGYTSNGSAGTETDHLRFLTAANQETCRIVAVKGGARFGTAGGMLIRGKTYGTPSTSGNAITPIPRNSRSPAASVAGNTAPTAGSGNNQRLCVGLAQTGGMGGEVNLEGAEAIVLGANGGANGNLDFLSVANSASVTFDMNIEIGESV